jgi:hypothetical protein
MFEKLFFNFIFSYSNAVLSGEHLLEEKDTEGYPSAQIYFLELGWAGFLKNFKDVGRERLPRHYI